MLTPTRHCILWDLIGSEMRTFLKYQWERPHVRGSALTVTHSPIPSPGKELGLDGSQSQVAQLWQWVSSTIYPLFGQAWADQFLLLGTFFWRREEISTNSQALLNWWSPREIFLTDSEEWYLELQICIGSVFPRNIILLWIINLTFPSTCLRLFSPSSWRLTLK